jgi:hypothetical protein
MRSPSRTLRYVAAELAHIGPWLAGSVFIAAAAKATGADALAARAFRGRQSRMIVVASLNPNVIGPNRHGPDPVEQVAYLR